MSTSMNTDHQHKVCPWWVAYTFDNFLRRKIDPADKVLSQWVRPGMTVMDFGCGLGHYAIGAAKIMDGRGKVIAVDLQEKMLEIAMKRAAKAGVDYMITPVRCSAYSIGYSGELDFIVAGNVLHETPDYCEVLRGFHGMLNSGGQVYFTEPKNHLKEEQFQAEIEAARQSGFKAEQLPTSFYARRGVLTRI